MLVRKTSRCTAKSHHHFPHKPRDVPQNPTTIFLTASVSQNARIRFSRAPGMAHEEPAPLRRGRGSALVLLCLYASPSIAFTPNPKPVAADPRLISAQGLRGITCKILPDDRARAIPLVIPQSRLWVEKFIIGLNLCPFAQQPFKKDTIRYAISGACLGLLRARKITVAASRSRLKLNSCPFLQNIRC
jgi:hypothetical protein